MCEESKLYNLLLGLKQITTVNIQSEVSTSQHWLKGTHRSQMEGESAEGALTLVVSCVCVCVKMLSTGNECCVWGGL